jgi:hypothetical protein
MTTTMKMVWMFVSPVIAAEWLRSNQNRKLKPQHVKRLRADLRAGRYLPTHEAIARYEDGSLADGQHRLTAMVEEGMGAWQWVCTGVPLDSREVIGGGITRSIHDQTSIAGYGIPRKAIDIIRCALECSPSPNKKPTTPEVVAFWQRHEEGLQFTMAQFAARVPRVSVAAVMVVVFRAYYTAEVTRLTEFCSGLYSGRCECGPDDGVIVLRNWLFRTLNPPRTEIYSKAESALVGFLKRQPMTKVYGMSTEQFPLPEETDPDPATEKELISAA